MDQRKYQFKRGKSIRRGQIVYSNLNLTDEKAEELMAENDVYKSFFEVNPKYAVEKVEAEDTEKEDKEKGEKAKLKSQIEEITGEKPKGNPGIDNLKQQLKEAKASKK